MNDKLTITTQTGLNVEANIICHLENLQNGKRYLYYTLNEIVGTGANSTVKIYVSKLRQNDSTLDEQITEEEWKTLKDVMAEVLKGVTNTNIKYIPASEIAEPVSVSERVIAMPVSYDYINKHRGIYAQTVATVEPTPVETPVIEEQQPNAVEPIVEVAPVIEETPAVESVEKEQVTESKTVSAAPIDLNEIEQKYSEMIETINRLKEQELEAAKRYNATIELSAMHNEQHANYVANEQNKEIGATPTVNISIEPEAITPIIPEPVSATTSIPTDIETNWFDMPAA